MPVSAAHVPLDTAKTWAKRLARTSQTVNPKTPWPLSRCQLAVAQMLGYQDWHALNQALAAHVLAKPTPAALTPTTKAQWQAFWLQCLQTEGCDAIFIHATSPQEAIVSMQIHGQKLAYLTLAPDNIVRGLTHVMAPEHAKRVNLRLNTSPGIMGGSAFDGLVSLKLNVPGNEGEAPRFQFMPLFPEGWQAVITSRNHLVNPRPLTSYGFPIKLAKALKHLTIRHTGAFLFTGMAGSGKSSLMASLVQNATSPRDPPEYRMPGVHAIPVIRPKNPTPNPYLQSGGTVVEIPPYPGQNKIHYAHHIPAEPSNQPGGLTLLSPAVAAAIDQDPGVLVIGEVRDQDTAEGMAKAIEAGITVFTTLHATPGAGLDRLVDFAPKKNWATMVRGWAHCRLLSVLCQQCAHATVIAGNRRGPGCAACQHRGYIGRQMVVDLWEVKAGTAVRMFDMATQASDLVEAGRVDERDVEDIMGPQWRDDKIMSAVR